jgi:hypothetical protein
MVPFLGHGMVPTLCSVRKNLRNGTVPSLCSVLEERNGTERGMPPPPMPAPLLNTINYF